jgi:aquaporin Z
VSTVRGRPLWQRALAEFGGTALLVLIGPGAIMLAARSGAFGRLGVSLAFGAAVWLAVTLVGPLSGAHINPAVSFGLAVHRRASWRDTAAYVAAQAAGAVSAAFALGALLGPVADVGATTPAVTVPLAVLVELGYAAIIGVAVGAIHQGRVRTTGAPILLGAVVALGAFLTGPLTGGSFNPARSFGPAVAAGVWTAHWLYWIAPAAGFTIGYALGMRPPSPARPRGSALGGSQ